MSDKQRDRKYTSASCSLLYHLLYGVPLFLERDTVQSDSGKLLHFPNFSLLSYEVFIFFSTAPFSSSTSCSLTLLLLLLLMAMVQIIFPKSLFFQGSWVTPTSYMENFLRLFIILYKECFSFLVSLEGCLVLLRIGE